MTAGAQTRRPGRVLFVSGAPGAGKSSVVEELLKLDCGALIFDSDWLLEPASELVGRSIVEAQETWPAYAAMWMRFLTMVTRNGCTAVYFGTVGPRADLGGVL